MVIESKIVKAREAAILKKLEETKYLSEILDVGRFDVGENGEQEKRRLYVRINRETKIEDFTVEAGFNSISLPSLALALEVFQSNKKLVIFIK